MNFSASDVIKALRLFEVANDNNQPRQVERLDKQQSTENTVCISFSFLKNQYMLYIDNNAEDDETFIYDVIHKHTSETDYALISSPAESDFTTFGLPFKGKDVYLLRRATSDSRLDSALVDRISGYSRSSFQKLVQGGHVMVNGVVETIPKRRVTLKDTLEIADQPDHLKNLPDVKTIYEDKHVLVIDKPVGLLTHAKGELTDEATAADYIVGKTDYKSDTNRPGIVHRLDRATSGVLLMVKTEEAAKLISRQFSDRKAKKSYYAVISGKPEQPKAKIDLPIGRNPSAPSTFRVDPNGKPAETTYIVESTNNQLSLILLQPKTGRTHQLRVHMNYIKCPIVGDVVYGGEKEDRMYLHAASLEVTLPGGRRQVFESPVPSDFNKFLEAK